MECTLSSANCPAKIFLYGGYPNSGNVDDGDVPGTVAAGTVYVLSLPSFIWQKQNGTASYGRWAHSCNYIGGGQMAVIGGFIINTDFEAKYGGGTSGFVPDPWPNGVRVFDLSTLR
jgi:hypothetical protein